ncbi:hypothetical protein NE237_000186 [Protea cynaroides]|uniref:Uncharacterized protein n=1 Tax=Protea cynaroides TaxID=273540 RepID=A0A9Q0KR13_9MAGN|nr:hypothetical protein NE237_000186 [Protea cynaroides]
MDNLAGQMRHEGSALFINRFESSLTLFVEFCHNSQICIRNAGHQFPAVLGFDLFQRERENPCGVCGHYHKYEEGEVCGICGHRMAASTEKVGFQTSAFPSEILPEFLYLGSYDNASRSELLKTQGISRVLNTVPACQNLYKNSFTYHCLQDDKNLPFDDAIQFLEQCENDKARVLVHCMSGKNRSPAIVIAYLMKCKGWRLAQSYQWVKERRPSVELTPAVYQQLQEYEQKIFGSIESNPALPVFPFSETQPFAFNFPKANDPVPFPVFNMPAATSLFDRPALNIPPLEFTFGAGRTEKRMLDAFGGISNFCIVDGDELHGNFRRSRFYLWFLKMREKRSMESLEGVDSRLRLFQIDLVDYDTLFAAINGTVGLFHLASLCTVVRVLDPKKKFLDPAIRGTINSLKAAKECKVKRVVVTSSISTSVPSPNWPSDVVKNEDCWTDLD